MMGTCSKCKKHDDLRPYGENGALICFDCGMLDEKTTAAIFLKMLSENGVMVLDENGPRPISQADVYMVQNAMSGRKPH